MRWIPLVLLPVLAARPPAPPAAPDPETIAANDNRRPAGRLEHGVLTLALEVRGRHAPVGRGRRPRHSRARLRRGRGRRFRSPVR